MPGDDRVDPSGRFAAHRTVAAALTDLPDADLADLLAHGRALGSGIGGTVVTFEVEGVTVFAKSIALTEVERRPENHGSSADLFGLPTFYQYPIGSTGFGAWRELAAHTMTTEWVLSGGYPGFPLTHHWRVLPVQSPAENFATTMFGGIDGAVAYWDGSLAVRRRLDAIAEARAGIVVFQEYIRTGSTTGSPAPTRISPWPSSS